MQIILRAMALSIIATIIPVSMPLSFTGLVVGGEVAPEPPTKFCLFHWFGLTDGEKAVVRKLIVASDGSGVSRKAIYETYSSFCAGPEYRFMVACLSFNEDVRDCLRYLEPNEPYHH